jgi:hypothetical protein
MPETSTINIAELGPNILIYVLYSSFLFYLVQGKGIRKVAHHTIPKHSGVQLQLKDLLMFFTPLTLSSNMPFITFKQIPYL